MPIIKSAKKRVRLARSATARNVRTKRIYRTAIKSAAAKPTAESLRRAQSAIDTAVKKGIMHINKASRKKRQLAAQAKAAGVKLTAKKPLAKKKTPAKKPAAKKPVKKSSKK